MFIHKIRYIHLWNWVSTSKLLLQLWTQWFPYENGNWISRHLLFWASTVPLKTSFPAGFLKARIWTGFYIIYKEVRNHFYLATRCYHFRGEILECSTSPNHVRLGHLNYSSMQGSSVIFFSQKISWFQLFYNSSNSFIFPLNKIISKSMIYMESWLNECALVMLLRYSKVFLKEQWKRETVLDF